MSWLNKPQHMPHMEHGIARCDPPIPQAVNRREDSLINKYLITQTTSRQPHGRNGPRPGGFSTSKPHMAHHLSSDTDWEISAWMCVFCRAEPRGRALVVGRKIVLMPTNRSGWNAVGGGGEDEDQRRKIRRTWKSASPSPQSVDTMYPPSVTIHRDELTQLLTGWERTRILHGWLHD